MLLCCWDHLWRWEPLCTDLILCCWLHICCWDHHRERHCTALTGHGTAVPERSSFRSSREPLCKPVWSKRTTTGWTTAARRGTAVNGNARRYGEKKRSDMDVMEYKKEVDYDYVNVHGGNFEPKGWMGYTIQHVSCKTGGKDSVADNMRPKNENNVHAQSNTNIM